MIILIFILGVCLGSFLNVCIYRLPHNESIITPFSYCPHCQKTIRPYDNIPLLSFLLLKGKCRFCKKKIRLRYFIVELLTGLLSSSLYFKYGWQEEFFVYLLLTSLLIVVSFIDFEHQIIPNKITYPGIVLGLLISLKFLFAERLASGEQALLGEQAGMSINNALLGLGIGGGFLYLVALVSRGNMGGGDIKLGAMLGVFLGGQYILVSLFLAVLFGSLVGIILILLKLKSRRDRIPFGPYLSLGTISTIFWGERILCWYKGYWGSY